MIDESTILRLNDDSNERYLQARVGNTAYNLQIYNKTQIIAYHRINILQIKRIIYYKDGQFYVIMLMVQEN